MEVAYGHRRKAGVISLGLLGDVTHRATEGAAPEQCALRTAQNFHALEVHEVELRGHRRRVVNVIDVDGNAGLEREVEIILADATDVRGLGISEGCLRLPEACVRDRQGDVGRTGKAALLDILGSDGADGDRGLLQILLPVAGSDDDLFEAAGGGRCIGRLILRRLVLRERSRCTQRKHTDSKAEQCARRGWLSHTFPLELGCTEANLVTRKWRPRTRSAAFE